MSRCFPFPPPGYVRKVEAESGDNVDSQKQDKHREKKDKKEKKDRDKRDSKDRKEKDRSNEKHRDKKEKKDKHKDRKKDKEKNKDREKEKEKVKENGRKKDHSSSSNDKKLPPQTAGINEEKNPKEKGPLPSMLPGGQTGNRSTRKEKERDKHLNSTPDGKRPAGQHVQKVISTNSNSLRDAGDNNKYVQELQKRVGNDRSSGIQLAEKVMVGEKKKDDGMVQFSAKPIAGIRPDGKELNKEREDNEQKVERANGTLKVHNFGGAVQSGGQEIPRTLEQNVEKEMEWREKFKGRESEDKRAEKWKEKDGEKKGQGKVKELGKEMEERTKEKAERNRHSDQERLKLSRKNDLLSSPNTKSLQQHVKEPDKIAGLGNVIKKRKEPETNGVLHANEIRPKMPKQALASHPPLENGKISEPHQTPAQVPPPWPGPHSNSNNIVKANKQEKKINGVTETRATPPPSSPLITQSSSSQAKSVLSEVPLVRPPHPDSKYLDEILSRVPRMEELPELDDDQGWLYDTDCEGSKKPKKDQTAVDELPQVWGESLHIESADIYALPYVIPY